MSIDRDTIRDVCTEAVFDRGEHYYDEGQVREYRRVDDVITATVTGSSVYDLTISLSDPEFDPSCTCPYQGPGACKHAVAVLLSIADDPPPDEGERIDAVIDGADASTLQRFLREELGRDTAMLDRFYATFGADPTKSHEGYREDVVQSFAEHSGKHDLVVDGIDFEPLMTVGERYRDRGCYREAAAVYRGLVAGIDDEFERVDGAYDHYATVFQKALHSYVACIREADLSSTELTDHEGFLIERAESGTWTHRERFRTALSNLRARSDE